MKQISPGRYRGLKTTSLAESDVFGIIAFDQRGSYRNMMPAGSSYEYLVQVKNEIIGALSQNATAILTDPFYGLSATMHMSGKSGLLMALEKSGYSGDASYRSTELLDGWTPEKIRKMGASAVKFMVYYNPQLEELSDKLDQLVVDVVKDCHQWDLPVFLEPMSYSANPSVKKDSAEYAAEHCEIVIETARRLSKTGADVLKMEFPLDIKYNQNHGDWRSACEQLSEASTVPWVLLSAGVDFEQFKPQVVIACESGASGFLAGRAIWKEAATMSTEDRAKFLSTRATDRLKELLDIAGEKSRPWSEFYSAMESSEDWFIAYGKESV
ncbi:MAG UNVERIFIED_CONTAM: tagatose 1,6-diphosphate aldolase [Anaerolineae bacterium]|jgi:tagatose 1,6-diphosphate aldolase